MISGRRIANWIDQNSDYKLTDAQRQLLADLPRSDGWVIMYSRRDGFKRQVNEAIRALAAPER